ncbi:NAD(P)H-dependent oxidoreductase [Lactovum miscens]|uniref:DUF438 domain-containing protein n=1 Tax=Lactovum miscens TaxID=190387 RepID=A0A841C626_9LACT|nr:NAD(P)H-dependent oxidoreductase [Lactovum miscens]MBB5887905.1 DUF438 domain-containing protein [Lactovum miscens]
MKLVAIVGSNSEQSYNRMLLQFIQTNFKHKFDLELLEIKDIPMFNQDIDRSNDFSIRFLYNKLSHADGIIIGTPEHNHTIPAALKSTLEWMSFKLHPLANKPVMIVGASYYDQGSSRAQLQLRQILDSPGINAYVLPGNEFLLGKAKEAFNDQGNIKNESTIKFLELCLDNFIKYVGVISTLKTPKAIEKEDLEAQHPIATTIQGIDPDDPDWVDKAAELTGAVSGNTYVKLDHGVLTVDQINMFLKSMPFELTYADDNNQFLYYNNSHQDTDSMLAKRIVGDRLATIHATLPAAQMKNVEWVIGSLRNGNEEVIRTLVPGDHSRIMNTHNYQAMYYPNGDYAGINEIVLDFKPWLDWYLKLTGQKLAGGTSNPLPAATKVTTDSTTGASDSNGTDESSPVETDSDTGASKH